jgi:hypothetical protein
MARPRSTMTDIRTSPRNLRLMRFLKRKPTPARLVGETLDGDEVKAAVSATGPAQWADVVGVLRACVKVQALDKDDQVLRVLELDPDDPELLAETETEAAVRTVARGGSAVPIISVDIPKLVDNIARNMREVASEAARQQSGAFKEGFGAMVSVVNVCLGLLVRVENRLAEVEDQAAQAQQQEETSGPQTREQLASLALQRALGGNGAAPTNGAGFNPADLLKLVQSLQQQKPEGGGDAHE